MLMSLPNLFSPRNRIGPHDGSLGGISSACRSQRSSPPVGDGDAVVSARILSFPDAKKTVDQLVNEHGARLPDTALLWLGDLSHRLRHGHRIAPDERSQLAAIRAAIDYRPQAEGAL